MHQSFMWFLWLNWRKSTFYPVTAPNDSKCWPIVTSSIQKPVANNCDVTMTDCSRVVAMDAFLAHPRVSTRGIASGIYICIYICITNETTWFLLFVPNFKYLKLQRMKEREVSWIFDIGHWTVECTMSNIVEFPANVTFLKKKKQKRTGGH